MGRGKRSEKSARSEDQEDKEPEPYQPTGNFQADFSELCKEIEMYRPPAVFLRPKRPSSPVQNEHAQAPVSRKGKEDKKAAVVQQSVEPEEETPEEKAVIEQLGFKPKTFSVKNYLDLMKPCVHVEMDNPDKQDSVTEVFIKNWRLELPMLRILGRCFERLHRLHTISFWRVAADAKVIREMAEMLKQLETVKCLSLESNVQVPEENYCDLIRVESNLTKLQLRFNHITDAGAAKIGEQLRGLRDTPSKLVSLDLSSNCVRDEGAAALAQALRTNRTLVHLSLSNNKLTDKGAAALAEVCSRFFLTHEETVERRKLLSVDGRSGASVSFSFHTEPNSDAQQTVSHATMHSQSMTSSSAHLSAEPPPSRRGADRPGSVRSQEKGDKKAAGGKVAAKGKKEEKPKPDDKAKGKGQKEEPKGRGKATPAPDKEAKGAVKSGKGKGNRVKVSTPQLDPEPELSFDSEHPLLERADTSFAPGFLLVPGNYVLALLNLSSEPEIALSSLIGWPPEPSFLPRVYAMYSREPVLAANQSNLLGWTVRPIFFHLNRPLLNPAGNQITDRGIEEWKTAIRYQVAYMSKQKVNGTGLLKLMLQGNPFSMESESYRALEQTMTARDPLKPAATASAD